MVSGLALVQFAFLATLFTAPATAFGGLYVMTQGGCYFANPWTKYQCTCPGRTSSAMNYDFNGPAQLYYCMDAAPDPSFGGAFQTLSNGSCLVPNDYTGGCHCPTSPAYKIVTAQAQQTTNYESFTNTTLNFCVGKESLTMGGMYYTVGWSTCISPNPLTGACTCANGNTNPFMADTMVDNNMNTGNYWACYEPCHAQNQTQASCDALGYCLYCANAEQTQRICTMDLAGSTCCANADNTEVTVCSSEAGTCVANQATPTCACQSPDFQCCDTRQQSSCMCCESGSSCCSARYMMSCCAPGTTCCTDYTGTAICCNANQTCQINQCVENGGKRN